MNTPLSRRAALGAGASAAALAMAPVLAGAEAPLLGVRRPIVYRGRLGAFEVATINDGAAAPDGPINGIFGTDQSVEDVQALLADRFLPTDRIEIGFAPVLVNTGAELILFDAGNGARNRPATGALRARLADAGYAPEQIDVVVLTHFHPDHIGGLVEDGAPAFPNARYAAPAAEYDFWAAQDGDGLPQMVRANVARFAEQTTMLTDGADVVSGVTAISAHGHTPGHTVYHIESDGRRLLIMGDAANHHVLSVERPDWEVRFDMDKSAAAATRRRLFDMAATDRVPFAGYHMPFPAVGYVEANGDAYRYTPASYQLNL